MDPTVTLQVMIAAAIGIGAGLWLLVRGMGAYRTATRIGDTSASPITSLAAGEVRIAGTIEPAEVALISPLQGARCVYYRSSVSTGDDAPDWLGGSGEVEERAVGFRVRDSTGAIRIFPHAARWDAPVRFEDGTDHFGIEPPGLNPRIGSAFAAAEPDRETAIAELLTVRVAEPPGVHPLLRDGDGTRRRRRYREARLEIGDAVTIVGRAMPFGDLADPAEADLAVGSALPADDPEVAMNIAEARAAGLLVDPEEAWGNAAIPGFGIGRPVRAAEIDPAASALPIATPEDAARAGRTFDIAPEALVLASAPDVPLLVAYGVAGAAVERHTDRFLLGLLGAILAIASAIAFAFAVSGGTAP